MSNFYEHGKAAMTSNNAEWETPQMLFDALDAQYHFTLDPCSTHANAKCAKHYTAEDDGLAQDWSGETVFCNPPYGRDMKRWVRKCAEESKHAKVIMLIPARTDTAYFHDYIYGKARITFLRGRLRFELGGVSMNSAPFPSMIVDFSRRWKRMNEPGRCKHETSLVDIGAGKSYCARLDRWTNCREAGHCVADDLLGEDTDGEDEA